VWKIKKQSWRSKLIQEIDSREIESRYQRISSKIDKMSKSIQKAISIIIHSKYKYEINEIAYKGWV
jgi:uncharacterized protein YaaN involved in tellurite resistance